jgi:raffinose/stachyose/melibiose transport system substrate-binding protein
MKARPLTRRDFLKLSATSGAGLVLAACGPAATAPAATSPPGGEPAQEEIHLEITDFQGGQLNYQTAYEQAAEMFRQQHPNVTINRRGFGVEEYRNALQPILASGDLPDIIGLYQGPDIRSAIEPGLIINLKPALDADPDWKARLDKAMAGFDDFHDADGNPYAVPLDVITIVVSYHKDLVADKGLTVGTTIDEFEATGRAFVEDGLYLSNSGDTVASLLVSIAQQTNDTGLALLRQAERGEISWQNDVFLNAWKTWQRLIKIEGGIVPPDLASGIEYEQGFYDRKWWACWYSGEWLAGEYLRNMPDTVGEVGVVNFPTATAEANAKIYSGGPGQTLSVANRDNQATAIEFLKFLSTPEPSVMFIQNSIHPPAAVENPGQHTDNPFFTVLLETFNSADGFVGFSIINPDVANRVIEHGGNIMLGAIEPEAVLEDLDSVSGYTG